MSFILDALRKSESERQRDTQPVLSRMPSAVEPPRLPAWAAGALALLALAVIGLGSAWWLSARTGGDRLVAVTAELALRTPKTVSTASAEFASQTPETASAASAEFSSRAPKTGGSAAAAEKYAARRSEPEARGDAPPAAQTRTPAAQTRNPALQNEAATEPVRTPTSSASARAADSYSNSPSTAPDARTRPAAEAAASDPATSDDTFASIGGASRTAARSNTATRTALPPVAKFLPSYSDAAAADPSMPELHLQLHAYYDDASRRFVFINGEKYVEGDTLKEGPRLIRITERGAVLALDGRQFLLPRP